MNFRAARIALVILLGNLLGGAILYLYFAVIDVSTLREFRFAGSLAPLLLMPLPGVIALVIALQYGAPLFEYLSVIERPGFEPLPETFGGGRIIHFRRRALRYPLVAAAATMLAWVVMALVLAGVVYAYARGYLRGEAAEISPVPMDESIAAEALYQSGQSAHRAYVMIIQMAKSFGLALLMGAVAGTFVFFLCEAVWQKQVPRFFPQGRLRDVHDRWIIPVRFRLLMIFLFVGTAPLVLLGILNYQRAGRVLAADTDAALGNLLLSNLFLIAVGVLLAVALSIFIARSVSRPLDQFRRAMDRVRAGRLDTQVQVQANDEFGLLAEDFNAMIQSLQEKEAAIRELTQGLEAKVRQRTGELEQALHEQERTQAQLIQSAKMASLGQLVAGIAHEINNPLSFVYANLDHLERFVGKLEGAAGETGPEFQETAAQIAKLLQSSKEGARRTREIVQNLRAFSRPDQAEPRPVDLLQGIASTLELVRPLFRDRITVHQEFGRIPNVVGLMGQLNQVFLNLLANAGEAMAGPGEVWIKTWQEGERVHVSIRDSGPGIPPENLSRIFDPFFTTKAVGKGTGLGLSIAYGIVEKHGGEIRVESNQGQGACFTVSLPIKR